MSCIDLRKNLYDNELQLYLLVFNAGWNKAGDDFLCIFPGKDW